MRCRSLGFQKQPLLAIIVAFALIPSFSGCRDEPLHIAYLPMPDYPISARFRNIQGTVDVKVSVGSDGKVIYAVGSGASSVLIQAATDNAKGWIFGPFPRVSEFPMDHTIQYVYVLEGKPKVVVLPPIVRTSLPDRIEIRAVPLVSDYPPVEESKPTAQRQKPQTRH